MIDGYAHHWDADALKILLDDNIWVYMKINDTLDSDQLNDNAPERLRPGRPSPFRHDDWLASAHGVAITPYFLVSAPRRTGVENALSTTPSQIIVKAAGQLRHLLRTAGGELHAQLEDTSRAADEAALTTAH